MEIAVDSIAVARIGLGGHVFALVRAERPRGHSSVDEVVDELVELAAGIQPTPRLGGPWSASGWPWSGSSGGATGWCRWRPNLGWRDVPLGARLARGSDRASDLDRQRSRPRRARGASARRGVGVSDVVFLSGEVGIGGGIIVDGRPLTGAAGYGGEVGHLPVNPAGATCRCGRDRAAGRPRSARMRSSAGRSSRGWGTERGRRRPVGSRAWVGRRGGGARPRRTLARPRSGRPGQPPRSRDHRAGWPVRAALPLRHREPRRGARPARPAARPGRSSGSCPRPSESTPRCSARPSWRSSPSWPIRGMGRPSRPDARAGERLSDGTSRQGRPEALHRTRTPGRVAFRAKEGGSLTRDNHGPVRRCRSRRPEEVVTEDVQ